MTQIQKGRLTKAGAKAVATKPIRLQQATLAKLHKILEAVNKKDFGKRIRPDAVVDAALSLVGAKEIEALRGRSMSNADRLERMYRGYLTKDKSISKDAFLGLLLSGELVQAGGAIVAHGSPEPTLVS